MTTNKPYSFKQLAFLELAFRPLFLMGSLFSIIALFYWGANLIGAIKVSTPIPLYLWHGHEMLFGFACSVIVGFLLTAVQNWTGLRSANGAKLFILTTLWLAGRVVMWPSFSTTSWATLIVDQSFLLYAAWLLGQLLHQKKQRRNYFAILVLMMLFIANLTFHISIMRGNLTTAANSLYGALFANILMMSIIGGRVIPMFTANTTQIPPKPRRLWLDRLGLVLLWCIATIYLLQLQTIIPKDILALIFGISSILIAGRCYGWRFSSTRAHPLLWSLHLSYWFIPLGFALISLHYAGINLSFSNGIHALTAGAMGGLILSMMSRVSLGHTGRPIIASLTIRLGLLIILFSATVRVLIVPLSTSFTTYFLLLSIVLWGLSYSLFLLKYTPILISARN